MLLTDIPKQMDCVQQPTCRVGLAPMSPSSSSKMTMRSPAVACCSLSAPFCCPEPPGGIQHSIHVKISHRGALMLAVNAPHCPAAQLPAIHMKLADDRPAAGLSGRSNDCSRS